MITNKIPVVFLSIVTSEKRDSINSLIAVYILDHIEQVKK